MRDELNIHKGTDNGLLVVYADDRVLEPYLGKTHNINEAAQDIKKALHEHNNSMSEDFVNYIGQLNVTIDKLFNTYNYYPYTATKENEDLIKSNLYGDSYEEPVIGVSAEKCYDFITTANGVLLVVVRKGFLKIMTESKQEYKDFLLNILRRQYEFSKSLTGFNIRPYLSSYLGCKMNDNYFDLIKLMA